MFDDVHGLYLKLQYENRAPTREEWVQSGGTGASYDALGANGSARNGLALKLADLERKLDQLIAAPVDPVAVATTLAANATFVQSLAAALAVVMPAPLTEQQVEDAAFRGSQRAEGE